MNIFFDREQETRFLQTLTTDSAARFLLHSCKM
jgi:hypothetical protein